MRRTLNINQIEILQEKNEGIASMKQRAEQENMKKNQLEVKHILLLGIYPQNPKTSIQNNLCTPMFIAVLFTVAKCWTQPKCPSVNEWIKKLWYIYTMEYYAAERKKELRPLAAAWMEPESILLSEISQAVKDKYHMILMIFLITFSFLQLTLL